MNWINFKEKLPKINQRVLVYQKNGVHGGHQIDIEYMDSLSFWSDQGIHSEITHWMPLPEEPNDELIESVKKQRENDERAINYWAKEIPICNTEYPDDHV